jgi:hypothetical protein
MAHTAHNAITMRTTNESLELLNRDYSGEEVSAAVGQAKARYQQRIFYDLELHSAWHILHVLTSNSAWAMGNPERLRVAWTIEVGMFIKNLILATQHGLEYDCISKFIYDNMDHSEDVGFLRLLRARILACSGVTDDYSDVDTVRVGGLEYGAIQVACAYDVIPVRILETLLEKGMYCDSPMPTGRTALMLALCNVSESSAHKVKLLIAKGARIDIFDEDFKTPLHIAAVRGNVQGVVEILRQRESILQGSHPQDIMYIDPLSLCDMGSQTPLVLAAKSVLMDAQSREQICRDLQDAGTCTATEKTVVAQSSSRTLCYGIITNVDDTIHIAMRKGEVSTDMWIEIEDISEFVSVDAGAVSLLPPGGMSSDAIENVFDNPFAVRFDFYTDANSGQGYDIDGIDFNVWFMKDWYIDHGGENYVTEILLESGMKPVDFANSYRLSMRFPRAPYPMEHPNFTSGYTVIQDWPLLHHASMCPDEQARDQMLHYARRICNPLVRCNKGFTALECFVSTLAVLGKTIDSGQLTTADQSVWNTMLTDHDEILRWIYQGAPILHERPAVVNDDESLRRPLFNKKSPFHQLPDDVCMKILEYVERGHRLGLM